METLFLQLPEQDPANLNACRNTNLFAGSLIAQAVNLGLLQRTEYRLLDATTSDIGGDAAIVNAIVDRQLDAVFFCLYDYNYERSLYIAKKLRLRLPATYIIALGPEVFPGAAVGRSRVFDSLIEVPKGTEWPQFCYPDSTSFIALLADLRQRNLQPCYNKAPLPGQAALRPAQKDPYLSDIITISADKPVFIGPEPLDILPPGRSIDDLIQNAPLLMQKACLGAAREIIMADPGLSDQATSSGLLKSLAAANHQGLSLQAYWRADHLNEDTAKLFMDANLVAMRSPLLTTNQETLHTLGIGIDSVAIERNAAYIWNQAAILKLRLYLGLPGDNYDSVIDSFDYLGMAGLGQEAELKPLSLLPGTACQLRSEEFGIHDALKVPPYTVIETTSLQEEDFIDALGDFEESFDVAVNPPVRPCLTPEMHGFVTCVDTRARGALDQLLVQQERLANSLSLIIDADNPESIKRLIAMAGDLRRENSYTLWQLILYSDISIPSDQTQIALTDAFAMVDHYFEMQHMFSLDPQTTWQTRLFFATSSEGLALRALHEFRELETIYVIKNDLPSMKLIEATPFLAFNREQLGFERLYDVMSLYRNFQDLLIDSAVDF